MFTHCVCTNVKNIINILNIIELSFKTTCQPREVSFYKRRPPPSIPDGKSYIKSPGGLVVSSTLEGEGFLGEWTNSELHIGQGWARAYRLLPLK